ncbi:MAG: LytTR family DNA-binding domain-containing protein [Bacteroidia bacterium]
MKAIAIDDEPLALSIIESFCGSVDFIALEKTFTKPSEALKHLRKFPVDLIFLDIQMPSVSGIDFYKEIKQETQVIFTTAHSQYAVEGFTLNATDYLLKPFTTERFLQAVNKAKEFYSFQHQKTDVTSQHIFLRADYSLLKINIEDILFIEGLDDYLKVHVQGQKTIVTRMTMKAISEKLPSKEFIRVHRSFIVPFSKISHVRNKTIFLPGGEIPIGGSYENAFLKIYSK